MQPLDFEAVVRKVVKTETDKGVSWRVVLENVDGHRVSLSFGSEEETHGYAIGVKIVVDVKNPQQVLQAPGGKK